MSSRLNGTLVIAIDDQSDHDSSYYIKMIEDCIERYVKFKDNHNEKTSQ